MATKTKYVLPRHYEKTGKLLADLRIAAGLTQREVAKVLRYSSAQFISNNEVGIAIPPAKKLKVIFRLYRLDKAARLFLIDSIMADERARFVAAVGE